MIKQKMPTGIAYIPLSKAEKIFFFTSERARFRNPVPSRATGFFLLAGLGICPHHIGHGVYPSRVVIQAGYEVEVIAAQFLKHFEVFHFYFNQRFEAVGYKSRTENEQSFGALGGQCLNNLAGVGLRPFFGT